MSEREFASYMMNIMRTQRVNSLTKCIELGKKLNEQIVMLSREKRLDPNDKIQLKELNARAVQSLDAELQTITEINNVVIPFVRYIGSIEDMLDKTMMICRYSYGYPWRKIASITSKSEPTLLRRHAKCIQRYMELNNIS